MSLWCYLKAQIPLIINLEIMFKSFLIRIVSFSLGFIFVLSPISLKAAEIDTNFQELESSETVEAPNQMTQKQMNDLFGEDPYLGQTSYLQSPEGFRQKENSK